MVEPAYHDDDDEPGVFDIPDDAADEAATLRGLADAEAGRVVDNDTVMRWVESWASGNPLPRPKCG
ncbi:CopG family transcriptional regulator [uncultured Brevundimonas sp.]|jgi:predicted transcriptional regulator|uniref:CopG family transcriptional regulator n=1 Tax=uncultured Brevundimonas sp. TaxID=213418 RepID=UPI0025F82461|nr:CopG family transcriptional regulator [uncultured Brevundimonas sp.]